MGPCEKREKEESFGHGMRKTRGLGEETKGQVKERKEMCLAEETRGQMREEIGLGQAREIRAVKERKDVELGQIVWVEERNFVELKGDGIHKSQDE